jgi:hypothetical protein
MRFAIPRMNENHGLPEESLDMSAPRRVFGNQAGPTAVGILVPPGVRTVVVVRPRSLPWDLLLVEVDDTVIRFREFDRSEAEAAAQALGQAFDEWSTQAGGRCEALPAPGSPGYCVCVELEQYRLVACPRFPGKSYRPMVWATAADAMAAADALRAVFCPPPGTPQEIYFNSRHFTRS